MINKSVCFRQAQKSTASIIIEADLPEPSQSLNEIVKELFLKAEAYGLSAAQAGASIIKFLTYPPKRDLINRCVHLCRWSMNVWLMNEAEALRRWGRLGERPPKAAHGPHFSAALPADAAAFYRENYTKLLVIDRRLDNPIAFKLFWNAAAAAGAEATAAAVAELLRTQFKTVTPAHFMVALSRARAAKAKAPPPPRAPQKAARTPEEIAEFERKLRIWKNNLANPRPG